MATEEVDMATVVDTDTEAGMGVVDTDTGEATEVEATGTEAAMGVEDMGTEVATDMARSNNESCPLNCSINLRIMFPFKLLDQFKNHVSKNTPLSIQENPVKL